MTSVNSIKISLINETLRLTNVKTKFRVCTALVARNVEAPVEKDRASSDKWPPPSRRLSSDRTGTDTRPLERHESATRCLQIKACSRFRQRLLAAPTLPRDARRRRVGKGHAIPRSEGLAVIQLRIDQPKRRSSQLVRRRLETLHSDREIFCSFSSLSLSHLQTT